MLNMKATAVAPVPARPRVVPVPRTYPVRMTRQQGRVDLIGPVLVDEDGELVVTVRGHRHGLVWVELVTNLLDE